MVDSGLNCARNFRLIGCGNLRVPQLRRYWVLGNRYSPKGTFSRCLYVTIRRFINFTPVSDEHQYRIFNTQCRLIEYHSTTVARYQRYV